MSECQHENVGDYCYDCGENDLSLIELTRLRALLPYVQHLDSCGDSDAYNGAAAEACGCGLDAARAALNQETK